MNLNSPFFDSIRVKQDKEEPKPEGGPGCDHPGCSKAGQFRAPKGRMREGEYFCFCLDHVKEYNQSYNYFKDMTDDDLARYQKESAYGHRPTWSMGVKRGARGFREDLSARTGRYADPFGMFGEGAARREQTRPAEPRAGVAQRKALATLGLDESADAKTIRARYKELVKRLHPDANGGDRSREEKLREIILAYKQLRSAKLA
ncbi:MAG: J domain-containing protein [Beijerinckiaceae bacterium]